MVGNILALMVPLIRLVVMAGEIIGRLY